MEKIDPNNTTFKERSTPRPAELGPLIFALLLVLLIAFLSYRTWRTYGLRSDQVAITQRVVDGDHQLTSALKDAETGQRGFLLTGDERYLEPYVQALREVPAAIKTLAEMGTSPDQIQRIEALQRLVNEKLDELNQTIDLRRSKKNEEALALVLTNRGKVLMDQIRLSCADIQTAAYARLQQYAEESRAAANQLGLIATLGSLGIFMLLVFSTVNIKRGTRRRQLLIRDLQASEAKTAEARDWFETTLGSIGDGVIATDAKGRVTFMNAVAESLTGWTQKDAQGRPLEQIFVITNQETGAVVENPVSKTLREGQIVGLANDTELIAKDARCFPIDDSAAPIRGAGGNIIGVVLVFRDITHRREAELRERKTAERVAQHARLLERANSELEQFAYAASHDLREPLRTISIYTELIQRESGPQLTPKSAEFLQFVSTAARRMERLIDGLLDYSKAGETAGLGLRPIPMNEILRTVLDNLSVAIEESRAVVTYDQLPTVVGNEIQAAQLIQNLISNALKYRKHTPPHIRVAARQEGAEWLVSVSDDGPGIAPHYHSEIFELFKRLHGQDLPGSGIGLAICKKIVESHGGRIWVESQEGEGSTFYFTMPAAEFSQNAVPPGQASMTH